MATLNDEPVSRHPLEADHFAKHFLYIKPLILERWPALDAEELEATNGDVDRVVELVAKAIDHDDMVRRQLERVVTGADEGVKGRLRRKVRALELRSQELLDQADSRARGVVTDNLWRNVFVLLGVGVLFGFVVGFTRR